MKLIIFDVYGTLISTGTGSLDAVKKILALQDKRIDPEEFYKEWKKQHRIHLDRANEDSFTEEEAIFRLDLEQLYLRYDINRDFNSDAAIPWERENVSGKRWPPLHSSGKDTEW